VDSANTLQRADIEDILEEILRHHSTWAFALEYPWASLSAHRLRSCRHHVNLMGLGATTCPSARPDSSAAVSRQFAVARTPARIAACK
jgi:hypothetical protein